MQEHLLNEKFVSLLLEHQKQIYGFILTLVPNFADADDIMQQVVMVMCRKFDLFKSDSSFLAWAIRIARYEINNFRRKQMTSSNLLTQEVFERISNYTNIMLDGMEDRVRALKSCLSKLNEKDAKLVNLHYEKGLTMKTIAQQIERPIQGLYKSFARIHNILRQCITHTLSVWETS